MTDKSVMSTATYSLFIGEGPLDGAALPTGTRWIEALATLGYTVHLSYCRVETEDDGKTVIIRGMSKEEHRQLYDDAKGTP